ncbi:MAG: CoA transferase, partial [Parvularculaceae bacterium]|nr:CoA transferase [Parvularculaceae bacterium]
MLSGLKIVEFEGLGPGPFCGMHLADLGADVILIARGGGGASVFNRGKRSISLDLKKPAHVRAALKIAAGADAIIEGLRPGVMERLGLGPDAVHAVNPKLVYGRITGWGQDGPLAAAAGHDINYVGLSGAAWYAGRAGDAPVPPPTMVGDIGGGAL